MVDAIDASIDPGAQTRSKFVETNLNARLAARHARKRHFVQCNSRGALPWTREQTSRGDLAGVRRDVQAPQRRDGARDLGLSKESHDAKHRQATVVDLRAQPGKSTTRRNGKDNCTAKDDGSPRKRCAESEQRQSLSLRKNTSLQRHPTRDFSAFHSSDLFFCRLKGSKSSNGMGCGISFFRDGNAPGLPPRM